MSKKAKIVWHNGSPPSLGWWPASTRQSEDIYRWWNGRRWSEPVHKDDNPHERMRCASTLSASCDQDRVQWKLRPASWPARSRT